MTKLLFASALPLVFSQDAFLSNKDTQLPRLLQDENEEGVTGGPLNKPKPPLPGSEGPESERFDAASLEDNGDTAPSKSAPPTRPSKSKQKSPSKTNKASLEDEDDDDTAGGPTNRKSKPPQPEWFAEASLEEDDDTAGGPTNPKSKPLPPQPEASLTDPWLAEKRTHADDYYSARYHGRPYVQPSTASEDYQRAWGYGGYVQPSTASEVYQRAWGYGGYVQPPTASEVYQRALPYYGGYYGPYVQPSTASEDYQRAFAIPDLFGPPGFGPPGFGGPAIDKRPPLPPQEPVMGVGGQEMYDARRYPSFVQGIPEERRKRLPAPEQNPVPGYHYNQPDNGGAVKGFGYGPYYGYYGRGYYR